MSPKSRSGRQAILGCLALFAATAHAAVVAPPAGVIDGTPAATVMQVNPSGIGHVNIVPYYAVGNGFDTYVNITNTDTRNGKAVKLRFRAAGNGDTVYDITLLLSPGDRWAAAITMDRPTGLPRLVHGDRSCTLPTAVQATFGTARLSGSPAARFTKAMHASEGYVEILNMADVPPGAAPSASPLFTAIQHVSGVAPCTSSVLNTLLADATSYADARGKGLEVPTTGLMSRWTLINVGRAAAYTGVATAIEARAGTNGPAGYGNLVLWPQTAEVLSNLEQLRNATSDPLLRGAVIDNSQSAGQDLNGVPPIVQAVSSDLPDLSTPYLPSWLPTATSWGAMAKRQIHATSRALAVSSFANEFVLDPSIAARTDWVWTLPTRRYNAAINYADPNYGLRYSNWTTDDQGTPLTGTANYFTPQNNWLSSADTGCLSGLVLESNDLQGSGRRSGGVFSDTEGGLQVRWTTSFVPAPMPPTICGSTGVLGFRALNDIADKSIFGSIWTLFSTAHFDGLKGGWARIGTPGLAGNGLPFIGFAAMELFNSAATPGFAGTYGLAFPHSTTTVP
jgi:hypothetical protein